MLYMVRLNTRRHTVSKSPTEPAETPVEPRGEIIAALLPFAVAIDSLTPLPGNPRRGDVEAVKRSLVAFGQRKPVIVRRADMTVTAGNHTLQAATQLGWSHIAAVITDDDELTARAFALADNRTSELGTYDADDLAALLRSVNAEAHADLMAATGYSNGDVLAIIRASEPPAFTPDVMQPQLDVRETGTCPHCQGQIEIRRSGGGAGLFAPGAKS
ncbi:MAG: ParB N-terminal domain-containing protein [Kofleriaceae bacterium]